MSLNENKAKKQAEDKEQVRIHGGETKLDEKLRIFREKYEKSLAKKRLSKDWPNIDVTGFPKESPEEIRQQMITFLSEEFENYSSEEIEKMIEKQLSHSELHADDIFNDEVTLYRRDEEERIDESVFFKK